MPARRSKVRICAAPVVLAAALTVSGCSSSGDGGGGGGFASLPLADQWQRFQAGNPTLDMTPAEVAEAWRAAVRRSTHFVDLGPESATRAADPAPEPRPAPEPPATPVRVEAFPNAPSSRDLQPRPGSSRSFAPVLEHHGIPVAEFKHRFTETTTLEIDRAQTPDDDATTTLVHELGYGGWLDHGEFRVTLSASCALGAPRCSETDPDFAFARATGHMAGRPAGTAPAGVGSATWTGVMVAMAAPAWSEAPTSADDPAPPVAAPDGPPGVWLGDARITIDDLAAPVADVAFTGIHDVTAGTRRDDLRWEDLRIQDDGLFGGRTGAPDGNEYIAGMFTGARHQEVGGHFERDGIAGAFGAKRQ